MAVEATVPPQEVDHDVGHSARSEYLAWRAATDLRAPYRVAPEFLADTKPEACWDTDVTPLIVFINARSGGRAGPELASVLARSLGRSQVFELSHHRPDTVLAQIWRNLDVQQRQGNPRAALVRQRLRILACGGDGTVAWILKVIKELNLQPAPPVAIMPLGTGNDLSRSFRWGTEFVPRWIKGNASVYSTLKRVADASVVDLDCWRLRLTLPDSDFRPAKTYAVVEAPAGSSDRGSGSVLMEGLFYNYFSVGADAQAAYNFHHLRDGHPALASNRIANQFWYSTFSCTSGWFCGAIPSVSRFSELQVLRRPGGSWEPLAIPSSIKALVLLNLQSYGGGRNIWGNSQGSKKAWKQPSLSDGLFEVVGFTHGYHAMAVMASHARAAHAKRLAQVAGIRLALRDVVPSGGPGRVFMQLDGEPWSQPVPAGNDGSKIMLEVVHCGTSKLLSNKADPDKHPTHNIGDLLSESQAAAYLVPPGQQQPQEQHKQQQEQILDCNTTHVTFDQHSCGTKDSHPGLTATTASEGGVSQPDIARDVSH